MCRFRLLIFLLIVHAVSGLSQPKGDYRREAQLLRQTILQNHLQPRSVNDDFSQHFWTTFVDELDPDRLYFTEQDLKDLTKYKNQVDDELTGNTWLFLDKITVTYKNSLQRSERSIQTILAKPFTWDKTQDSLWLDEPVRSLHDQENYKHWVRWLKYKTLDRVYSLAVLQNTFGSAQNIFSRYEAEARNQVRTSELRNIQRILNHSSGFERYVANAFLRTLATTFDPHTMYLSQAEMENFIASISSEGFSFGIALDENERGEVIISHLVPGGPAWKSGELHTSDVLTHLKWEGAQAIDLYGLDLDEVGEMLMESNHSMLELSVRKTGGVLRTVRLRKEKIALEENVVRSFLLKGEKTIGYIALPGFYSDWEDDGEGNNRCANDVAKEIVKLGREKIDGLILDVRYNGGGSLKEALEMAGIFIDQGSLGIVKGRSGELVTIKDNNRGTVYDGPLVVMVNRLSASASEFLAAALQDHNRAIIVGSQTYGKATAQRMFPLDPGTKDLATVISNGKGFGYATVTVNKIYRVDGRTVQSLGVKPDITLPDILNGFDLFESSLPGALSRDSVQKKTYYTPSRAFPLAPLLEQSKSRVDSSEAFRLVKEFATIIMLQETAGEIVPLSWNEFAGMMESAGKYEKLESMFEENAAPFEPQNNTTDINRMKVDIFMAEMNKHWMKNLRTDIHLAETFHIICDYIRLNQSSK